MAAAISSDKFNQTLQDNYSEAVELNTSIVAALKPKFDATSKLKAEAAEIQTQLDQHLAVLKRAGTPDKITKLKTELIQQLKTADEDLKRADDEAKSDLAADSTVMNVFDESLRELGREKLEQLKKLTWSLKYRYLHLEMLLMYVHACRIAGAPINANELLSLNKQLRQNISNIRDLTALINNVAATNVAPTAATASASTAVDSKITVDDSDPLLVDELTPMIEAELKSEGDDIRNVVDRFRQDDSELVSALKPDIEAVRRSLYTYDTRDSKTTPALRKNATAWWDPSVSSDNNWAQPPSRVPAEPRKSRINWIRFPPDVQTLIKATACAARH